MSPGENISFKLLRDRNILITFSTICNKNRFNKIITPYKRVSCVHSKLELVQKPLYIVFQRLKNEMYFFSTLFRFYSCFLPLFLDHSKQSNMILLTHNYLAFLLCRKGSTFIQISEFGAILGIKCT